MFDVQTKKMYKNTYIQEAVFFMGNASCPTVIRSQAKNSESEFGNPSHLALPLEAKIFHVLPPCSPHPRWE